MNLKETVEFIVGLGKSETRAIVVDGKDYATKDVFNPPHPRADPLPKAVQISTLTGLVDFVTAKIPKAERQKYFIHVLDYRTVTVLSDLKGFHLQREQPAFTQADDLFTGAFKFNQFTPHSTFMIAVQTLFQEHNDWEEVTKLIANIKEENVMQSQDDGLSQTVTAKSGIALVTTVAVPRIVTLKPYRTFREIEQPSSQFVLRLQSKTGQMPEIALFEADGGKWKTDAIEAIAEYLRMTLGADFGLPIIA